MGRLTNEEKATKARQTLIETIAKIEDLEPILGGKWRRNMLGYYIRRLAELLLYQSGFDNPTPTVVASIETHIRAVLQYRLGD